MLGNLNLSLARRTMLRQLGWGMDLDGATENLQITNPKNVYSGEYSLKADFANDVVGQAPAGWNFNNGSFQTKSQEPSFFGGTKYIEATQNNSQIYTPCNQAYGQWEFDIYKGDNANSCYVYLNGNSQGYPYSQNSYVVGFNSSEKMLVQKINAGTVSDISTSNISYINNNTWYRIRLERLTNGQFTVWIKGGNFGDNFTLMSVVGGSGTNPATENSYTSFNYLLIRGDLGDRFANIQCEQGTGSFDLSGFERIFHSGNRDFEQAVTYGADLFAGYDFTNGFSTYGGGTTVPNANTFITDGLYNSGLVKSNVFTPGQTYLLTLERTTTSSNFSVNTLSYEAGSARQTIGTTNGTYIFTASYPHLYLRHNSGAGGQTSITILKVQELKSDWQGSGNHSCHPTGEDKKSGSFCLKMISSGAGDANNCITLAPEKFKAVTPTDKFTFEVAPRGTGILGNELCGNSTFDADTWWVKQDPTITIADGVCHFNNVGQYRTLGKSGILEVGATYRVVYTVKNYVSGNVTPALGLNNGITRSANGTYVDYVTCLTTAFFCFQGNVSGNTYDIDDVSIKKITLPNITISIGSKQKTISAISCIPGSFGKAVHNFEATAAEINQGIKIWANQADQIYLDEIQFKQAFDCAVMAWAKTNAVLDAISNSYAIFSFWGVSGINFSFRGGYYNGFFFDVNNASGSTGERFEIYAQNKLNNNDNVFHLYAGVFDRTSVDGSKIIYDGSIVRALTSNCGIMMVGNNPLRIGNNPSSQYFPGSIGELQFVRFNNIALSDFDATKYFKSQIPRRYTGGGSLVTLHMKFKGPDDATFLKDYSPLQQLVTGINVTKAGDQVRGAYPYFSR